VVISYRTAIGKKHPLLEMVENRITVFPSSGEINKELENHTLAIERV
jgi:hypothetical protein